MMGIQIKALWITFAALLVFASAGPVYAVVINDFEGTAGNAKDWDSGDSLDVDPDYSYDLSVGVTSGSQSVHLSNVTGWGQTLALDLDYAQRVEFMANNVFSIDITVPANFAGSTSGWTKIEGVTLNAEGYGFVGQADTDYMFGFWENSGAQTVTFSFDYTDAKASMPAVPGYVQIVFSTNSDGAHTDLYFDNARLTSTEVSIGAYDDEILADSPVLYLQLEEDTAVSVDSGLAMQADSSGNNYWAVHRAGSDFVPDGGIGNCRYLTAVEQTSSLAAGNTTEFDWTFDFSDDHAFSPDDITFEFWYNSDANDMSAYAMFFQQVKTNEGLAPGLGYNDGTFRVLNGAPTDTDPNTGHWWYPDVAAPLDGAWHQVVVTYQETYGTADEMAIQLYFDGQLANSTVVGDATWPAKLGPEFDHVVIGGANDIGWTWNNYKGLIDEFAIYDGILSAERIAAHYGAGLCAMSKGDITGDCKVDMADFAEIASTWLLCNDPALIGSDPDCAATW